jgi:ABC-type amino acid transport substrate-binding protein
VEPGRVELSLTDTRFIGDFDQMLDRRGVRVVVPFSRTLCFVDKGTLYGTTADGVQLLQEWLNRTFKLGARPLTVRLIPTSRDKLFDAILTGDGDIAGGDITITEERRKRITFTSPILSNVREIVVTSDEAPDLEKRRGALRQEGRDPPLDQLLREPDQTERAARRAWQAACHHKARPRHARERGSHGDDSRRVATSGRGR